MATEPLELLVSEYTGIVRGVEDVLADPCDIRLVNVYCETGHSGELVGGTGKHPGSGSGRSRAAARTAAIAEAVERYSACASGDVTAVVATAEELGGSAVHPSRFALFSERQHAATAFPYRPFTAKTRLAWVEGRALPSGEPAYVPAQLVYLRWTLRPGEQRIASSTSSGLACRATFGEAVLTGLLEAVERDAFMITWKARLSWPQLVWPRESAPHRFERAYVRPTGLAVAAIDLSPVWEIPCVLGVARSRVPGEAPIGVGAGAALDVDRAIEKAIDEAVRVRSWARAIRAMVRPGEPAPSPDEVVSFEDHIRYHAFEENAAATMFLDASGARRPSADVAPVPGTTTAERIAAVCRRLAAHGASAYAVDVTAPDVRDAGLRVARVIAPELCRLDVEHATRHLGGRRQYVEPIRLGFRTAALDESDLNPDPHPFP